MNIAPGVAIAAAAGCIAFLLNKISAKRIEKRTQRLGLQAVTWFVCFLLSVVFIIIGSLRTMINNFIDEKITYIENELNVMFPDTNLLETNIDTTELASILNKLHGIIESDSMEYDHLKTIILNVFIGRIKNYLYMAENQAGKLANAADENGMITIKSILFHIKEQSLDAVSPYFMIAQNLTVMLLAVYVIVYICIIAFLKKSGGLYNKSIVFGDGAANVERGMDDSQI